MAIAIAVLAGAAAGGSDVTRVLLTKEEALRAVFPGCERALEVRRMFAGDEKQRLEKRLRRSLEERGFLVYLGLRGEALDGVAVITNEIGKTEPITFIVAANLDGTVRRVAVMVYRETHGGEVEARRFLAQFERKSLGDPIELHRDVINVSGATLSATALCNGTRKVLSAIEELGLRSGGAALVARARADGAREIALDAGVAARPAAATAAVASPVEAPQLVRPQREARRLVMGSELRVVALDGGSDAHEAVQRALDEAERLDAVLSDWRDDSELSRLNRDAAQRSVEASPTMLEFLEQSVRLGRESRGAFDPTIGELVRAWGFRGGPLRRPGADELARLVAGSGLDGIAVHGGRFVRFTRPAIRLDPGAIGKGMAVDAVADALLRHGITNAFVDFGSTQRALGPGEHGAGWPVAILDPRAPGGVADLVFLRDRACSTSAATERSVEIDGRRFAHVIDPRTGMPAASCASATVLASTAARADALSTALFVLGPDAGTAMIEAIPDATGRIETSDGTAVTTRGWPQRPRAVAAR